MYDRAHGASGYTSSHHVHRPKKDSPQPKKEYPKWLKPLLIALSVIILGVLFLSWLMLGQFRFMMGRVPGFTGFPFTSRSYVVMVQNNYNLNPAGGATLAYGTLEFSHGIYKGFDFYEEDLNEVSFLNTEPDFMLNKEDFAPWYSEEHPDKRFDGLISIDLQFLKDMVQRYEPMYVEGQELTSANLFQELTLNPSLAGPLVKSLSSKTLILPWRIPGALGTLAQNLDQKHVLAAFNKNGMVKSFAKRQWDGRLPQPDSGDFLAVNLYNQSNSSSDRYITRDVQYEIELTNRSDVLGSPVILAHAQVTLSHEGTNNLPFSGTYTGQLRTMIPLGSDVVSGSTETESREDVEVLLEELNLEPGDTVTFDYTYELPEYVWKDGLYTLHLHKQAGSEANHYRVVARLPENRTISGNAFEVRENVAFFESNLAEDAYLSFTIEEAQQSFRMTSAKFLSANQIQISFNDRPNLPSANPLASGIIDLDLFDPEVTDDISIEDISIQGQNLIIQFSGMSSQAGESYELILEDIQSSSGSSLAPNPLVVTLKQDIEVEEEEEAEEAESTEEASETTDNESTEEATTEPVEESEPEATNE